MDDPNESDVRHLKRKETSQHQHLDDLRSRRALLMAWAGLFVACASLLVVAVAYVDGRTVAGAGFAVVVILFVDSVVLGWRQA